MRLIDADELIETLNKEKVPFNADVNEAILNAREIGGYADYVDKVWEIAHERGKEEALQWIQCSERLPTRNDGDGVLVSTTKAFGGLVEVIFVWTSSVELYYQKGWVIAWMPLPQPYRGDEE